MNQPFIQRFRQMYLRRHLPLADQKIHWASVQKYWFLAITPLMLTWVVATSGVLALQKNAMVSATDVLFHSGILLVHYCFVFFIAIFVERLVSRATQRNPDPLYWAHAVVVALLVPESMSVIQILIGMTFGIVFGRVAFGGSGNYIIHPGLLVVAFLLFSFPDHTSEVTAARLPEHWMYPLVMASTTFGFIYLLLKRMYTMSLLCGVLVGTILVFMSLWLHPERPFEFDATVFGNGTFLILLVFVLPDVSVQPSTSFARFIYGLTFVVLSVLFFNHSHYATQALVNALLLLSVLSPMMDRMVVFSLHAWRRRVQEQT